MFDEIRRIKRKYEMLPPGDNIPLYGDFIEFKDEFNGATYIGGGVRSPFQFNTSRSNLECLRRRRDHICETI
ncbi:hypothetical protein DANISAUR_44 [Proteus phage vB_PmiS_DanisaurMW]|nr:hypothetical protein DANISAUR_44 [Proteus phage vB_PmiS_DanisaurMW]